ncbi:uncharacterized protein LOC134822606 [Bolinopsis microptera]|uniref:uncharacterized protein LOC134822606 n=1 Tax=Bolinopsis microptera TaxID=2820187 RepID=UPI003078B90D
MNKHKKDVASSSGKHKKTPEQKRIEKLEEDGKEVYKNLGTYSPPLMIPQAPNLSNYIDKYDKDSQLSKSNLASQQRQQDYEAEVEVYRGLERVNGDFIVIQGLKYTHGDYTMFVGEHLSKRKAGEVCKMKNKETEEECDFVVIGENYAIVIEVKNVGCKDRAQGVEKAEIYLNKTFKDSVDQRSRTVKLITGISKEAAVLQFTAYPYLSHQFKNHFQVTESELSSIIFQEDIKNIRQWWKDNVKFSLHLPRSLSPIKPQQFHMDRVDKAAEILSSVYWFVDWQELWELSGPADFPMLFTLVLLQIKEIIHQEGISRLTKSSNVVRPWIISQIYRRVEQILVALWCTEKNKCDTRKCTLGRTINAIDKGLKDGDFTFHSKNRDPNPAIASETPDTIKNSIGVNNLTIEQLAILKSEQKLMWINGPAGSGKSVIMCGKILELALSDDQNKISVFFFPGPGNPVNIYESALEKAGVAAETVVFDGWKNGCEEKLCERELEMMSLYKENNQVVIIKLQQYLNFHNRFEKLIQLVKTQKGSNIFIDDAQLVAFHNSTEKSKEFSKTLVEFSRSNFVWVACDIAQSPTDPMVFNGGKDAIQSTFVGQVYDEWQVGTLHKNLRNTSELAGMLALIRDIQCRTLLRHEIRVNELLPEQAHGHFIHGPRTKIYVFVYRNHDLLGKLISQELTGLLEESDLKVSDIGVVYTNYRMLDLIKVPSNHDTEEMGLCCNKDSPSAEWSAVIGIFGVDKVDGDVKEIDSLSQLYLMISRARVKCTIFMYLY